MSSLFLVSISGHREDTEQGCCYRFQDGQKVVLCFGASHNHGFRLMSMELQPEQRVQLVLNRQNIGPQATRDVPYDGQGGFVWVVPEGSAKELTQPRLAEYLRELLVYDIAQDPARFCWVTQNDATEAPRLRSVNQTWMNALHTLIAKLALNQVPAAAIPEQAQLL